MPRPAAWAEAGRDRAASAAMSMILVRRIPQGFGLGGARLARVKVLMRILVTGARGKVGAAAVHDLITAGHDVTGCDLAPPVYEAGDAGAHYVQADLTDAGDAFAVIRGHDAVIHAAALPEPTRNPAARGVPQQRDGDVQRRRGGGALGRAADRQRVERDRPRLGVRRAAFSRAVRADRRGAPSRPQDPYALAKLFGEQIMDAAVARSDIRAISIRPTWVQWEGNYAQQPRPRGCATPRSPQCVLLELHRRLRPGRALRLAAESPLEGHEAMYIASPTTTPTAAGGADRRPLRRRRRVARVARQDAGGISIEKARAGCSAGRRALVADYLSEDGELLPEARERPGRGETGVSAARGRARRSSSALDHRWRARRGTATPAAS